MANGGSEKNGTKSIYLALYFLGAVVSGGGGTYAWLATNGSEIVAPDRFTGTQASELIKRINKAELDIEGIQQSVYSHKVNHPDRALEVRIALLEANYIHIVSTLERIEGKIDGAR